VNRVMNVRIKLLIVVPVALGLLASGAAAAKTHNYKSTLTTATLSTGNGYPNPGGTAVLAGSLELSGFGAGALVDKVKITGHPQPNVFAVAGTEVDYLATGTWRSTFKGTSTVHSDGSQSIDITGRFIGGTGPYKRAKGSFHFTGAVPSGSTVLSGHSTGSLTY
jgi:hypothetical protein